MKLPPGAETKAVKAKHPEGLPAWHGKYRLARSNAWRTARSSYGAILYTAIDSARAGALWCACEAHSKLEASK